MEVVQPLGSLGCLLSAREHGPPLYIFARAASILTYCTHTPTKVCDDELSQGHYRIVLRSILPVRRSTEIFAQLGASTILTPTARPNPASSGAGLDPSSAGNQVLGLDPCPSATSTSKTCHPTLQVEHLSLRIFQIRRIKPWQVSGNDDATPARDKMISARLGGVVSLQQPSMLKRGQS
jgi:hypothetical protein